MIGHGPIDRHHARKNALENEAALVVGGRADTPDDLKFGEFVQSAHEQRDFVIAVQPRSDLEDPLNPAPSSESDLDRSVLLPSE